MIPLLVASAFALSPPAKAIEIVKPPDDIILVESLRSDRTLSLPLTHHMMLVGRVARLGPLSALAIEWREGGFQSGFVTLTPGALPPAPLTTAGFWSMGRPWHGPTQDWGSFGCGLGGFGGAKGGGRGGTGSGGGRGGRGGR